MLKVNLIFEYNLNKMRRSCIYMLGLVLQCSMLMVHAQDPVQSNFYANLLRLNPALAGIEGVSRLSIGYRNQWPNSGSSYVTYQANYDQFVEKLHGGVGISIMNDRQGSGVFNSNSIDLIYNYQFRATRKLSFSGGIQAGVGQRGFDGSSLLFASMIRNNNPGGDLFENYSIFFPDFATGFHATYMNLYGGASIHHLIEPVITDMQARLDRKYSLYAGALIPVIDKSIGHQVLSLSPNIIISQQSQIQQLSYGLDAIYEGILVGLWARHDLLLNNGSFSVSAGFESVSWRFRYSYDLRIHGPSDQTPNMSAHEFTFIFIYGQKNKRKGLGAIKCPKI